MINQRFISISFTLLMSISLFAFLSSSATENLQKTTSPKLVEKTDISKDPSKGDTLFVIHFHPTVQCSCCINVGIFSKKSLEKYYPKPYKDGRIVFKECNIDQDSLTAQKYKIFGSALGFKKLFKGKEKFKEIESVWEFCEDEAKFLPTFKKEMDEFLNSRKMEEGKGKSKK
jgi:hypothetical protein